MSACCMRQVPSGASGAFPGCEKLIASAQQTSSAQPAVLADRTKSACYLLGPVLVTGAAVRKADAVYDDTLSSWTVDVHFGNDDFLNKIAAPLVGKEVAIILDGVVQSAPTINPGITGRDVEISGNHIYRAIRAKADQGVACIVNSSDAATSFCCDSRIFS